MADTKTKAADPGVDLDKWHETLPEWLRVFPPAETDEDVSLRIAEQIMHSESEDDVLSEDVGGVGLRDVEGVDITVHDVRLRPSDQDTPTGAYALIAFTRGGSDEQEIATSGATNVMAQLVRLYQLGAFPVQVQYYETPSKSNPLNKVGRLRAAGSF